MKKIIITFITQMKLLLVNKQFFNRMINHFFIKLKTVFKE